jgi:hypothetical protein
MAKSKIGDAANYILPLGILGLAAFVLYKMGLFSGSAGDSNAKGAAANWHQMFLTSNATTPQSLTDAQLNAMVTQIVSDYNQSFSLVTKGVSFFTGSAPITDDIVTQLSNLDNITDLYRLGDLFGTQALPTNSETSVTLCSELGMSCPLMDLGTFIHNALSPSQLALLNQDLVDNGINYSFS